MAKENSRLANQAALLKDWLFIQTSLETEYTDAVSDLETLATSPDALKNAAAIELLANDLRVAEHMLSLESPQKVTERLDELIVFFTAGRCSLLRKRVGIALSG